MPIILIPLFIILAIAGFNVLGTDILKNINFELPSMSAIQERSDLITQKQPTYKPSNTTSSFILDTKIIKGPENKSTIDNSNSVTFEFSGSIIPDENVRITYDTYIPSIDKYWKPTSSNKRTIKLPSGTKQYTFKVRAKYKGEKDYTPASTTFIINTSPFYGKVEIKNIQKATSNKKLLITLRPNISSNESINITGWKVQGDLGGFTIPLGIEKISNSINFTPLNNITLRRGDTAYLTAEKSPFGRNVSFKPNLCMGYLNKFYTFPISVTSSCPDKPSSYDLRFFREECENFILNDINFSSCTIPSRGNNPNISNDRECISYIENNFNYNACYKLHKDEKNFTKSQWHIYMERDFIRERYDTIKLLDQDNRIVDSYIY